ncbi:MAG: hypothetical protein AB1668_06895 [Nanoarchaeota archaeon]
MEIKNSLIESLHSVLPEPSEEETVVRSTGLFSGIQYKDKKRPQEEIINGKILRTYRYNPILDTPYLDWPEMNLYAETNLAKIVDDLLGGLSGKTVVSYRPEHYPFFGVQTARRGAETILVDDRPITAVEDLINGNREYSEELTEKAKRRFKELEWDKLVSEETDRLMKLSEFDLMQIYINIRSPKMED